MKSHSRPSLYPFLLPVGKEGRGSLRKPSHPRRPRNLPEQSRPIRHLANGRQGMAAKAFQRQDLAPQLRSPRFLCSETSSGWHDVGDCPHPRSAEPQQRDLKAGTKAASWSPGLREELSSAVPGAGQGGSKGQRTRQGTGQGMLRGCQGQNTLSAEGNN